LILSSVYAAIRRGEGTELDENVVTAAEMVRAMRLYHVLRDEDRMMSEAAAGQAPPRYDPAVGYPTADIAGGTGSPAAAQQPAPLAPPSTGAADAPERSDTPTVTTLAVDHKSSRAG
ncbi:MAG: hypothetical protein AAGF46_09310, partial [Pseudomonadota bacterium]